MPEDPNDISSQDYAVMRGEVEREESRPNVTILDLALHRLGRTGEQVLNGADFLSVGLQIMGGCASCHASLAAYNAHPSKQGVWKCASCLGDDGWTNVWVACMENFVGCPTTEVHHG